MLKSHVFWLLLVTFFLLCHQTLGEVNLTYVVDQTSIDVNIDPGSIYKITDINCIGTDNVTTDW